MAERQITEQVKQSRNGLVSDLRKKDVWKGDHSACEVGHRDQLCCSISAWRLDGSYKICPVVVGRPTNKRFHSMVEYDGPEAKEPEPAWRAKGWRETSEIARTRPIRAVVAKMREHAAEELERGMQFKKFEYADIVKVKADCIAQFDKSNAHLLDDAAIAPQPSEVDSAGIVPPNPPPKGRARG